MIYLQIILTIILALVFTYYTAKIDDVLQEKEQYLYKSDKTIRLLQRIVFSLTVCIADVYLGFIAGLVFNLTFDQIKNKIGAIKYPLFYLGTESNFDTFYSKKMIFYYSQKILTIIALIIFIHLKLNYERIY